MSIKTIELASGQKIAYRESSGTGHPILLLHGNACSSKSFKHQLTGDFGHNYRVIAMDFPGHGDSSFASDPANYSFPGFALAVAAFVKALDIENAVVVGWSMGGHVVLEAHDKLVQSAGFVIFGAPPIAYPVDMENLAKAFLPPTSMAADSEDEPTEEEKAQRFAAAFFAPDSEIDLEPWVADILATDIQSRTAELGTYADEVDIVANLKTPLAILHGEKDQLINEAYISGLSMSSLWRDSVQMIADAGHAPHWEKASEFNALLEAFIQDVTS